MFGFSNSTTAQPKFTEPSSSPTEAYTCTLHKDWLVFYGGKYGSEIISEVSVYNLKEKRMEQEQAWNRKNPNTGRFSHSACLYEKENAIIYFGGQSHFGKQNIYSENFVVRVTPVEDEGHWYLEPGISGPYTPSTAINFDQDKLYVYTSGPLDGNFGSFTHCEVNGMKWCPSTQLNDNMRLSEPSDCAIFSDNNLYLFARDRYLSNGLERDERYDPNRDESERILEDVYILDLAPIQRGFLPRWKKVSSQGQAPGVLKNVSMAEANGIIYIFGTSGQKSGLWTYDTKEETWSKKEAGTLTAGPNQRAVVYNGELLIIDWDYPNQTVKIQYQNSNNNLTGGVPSSAGKEICRDQPDSFVQQYKNLYNGRLFADITFEVEGEEIPAHKAILAYRSDYFMKMFNSGMSESHSTKISIPNIKSHIFKALLQYIYCNEIELDEQLALDLIPVVDEYLMKGMKGLCEKYLCKQLRKENVVDMLIVADRHEIEELKKSCFRFILKNLGNIDENEEMMKLSKSLFIELLKFNTSSDSQSKTKHDDEEEKSNSSSRFGVPAKASPAKTKMPATASHEFSYATAPVTRFVKW